MNERSNTSSDFIQVELVGMYFLKLGRAQEAGDWDAATQLDRMIRCHLKDLKATKISREGEAPRGSETTPADWATTLLEKVLSHDVPDPEKKRKGPPKKNPSSAASNTKGPKPKVPTGGGNAKGRDAPDGE